MRNEDKKMKKKIYIITIVFMAIVFLVLVGSIIPKEEIKQGHGYEVMSCVPEVCDTIQSNTTTNISIVQPIILQSEDIVSHSPSLILAIESETNTSITPKLRFQFASLTISTDKKTRIFEIMPDVYEKTLKRNIGWLPSSAYPGEEGLSILMGHRDTDFSILQYVKNGDLITIQTENANTKYKVVCLDLVDSDEELRFKAITGTNLVLITCYPFRYTGHAPRKYVVYCKITK